MKIFYEDNLFIWPFLAQFPCCPRDLLCDKIKYILAAQAQEKAQKATQVCHKRTPGVVEVVFVGRNQILTHREFHHSQIGI